MIRWLVRHVPLLQYVYRLGVDDAVRDFRQAADEVGERDAYDQMLDTLAKWEQAP